MTRPAENRPATPLVGIATCDLGGIVRGRFVPTQALDAAMATGIGWLPANLALTPFNGIADNLFGSRGDLRILPDPGARFIADTGGATPFDLLLGDVVELDGQPWSNCPRGLLKRAVAALHERTGWHCIASFEQEFQLLDRDLPPVHALSLAAVRQVDPFASQLVGALEQAGIQPETVLAEFGRDQFEITCAPAPALQATDRAIAIREIAREIARRDGGRASFAPKTDPSGVGNGVHIHLSLRDASGAPVGYDPARPGCLSRGAGAFFAGIVRHLPALTALTASSPISYLRLRPNSWSAAYTWLGERDREASLRICPVTTLGGRDPARQYNVEYRPADATANPYLALAAILYAGLAGIAADLEPAIFAGDPSRLSEEERAALGLARLPETLEAALAALKSDTVLGGWLPLELVACFAAVKRVELDRVAAMDAAGACALYAGLY